MKKLTLKPGWKTTEFWFALVAMVVAALVGSDAFADASMAGKILAFAGSALASMGYTVGRSMVKSSQLKAQALAEAAQYVP